MEEYYGPSRKRSLNQTSMNPFESSDHFSVLPDHLLLHILSFLPATDVIKSSFLSRRWKSLWMYVPTIDFKRVSPHNLVKIVDRFLVYYKPMKIQKFLVTLSYEDAYSVNIDSWINFTMGRDVEKLVLQFLDSDANKLYKLPSNFFRCASLRNLSLSYCDLNLPSCVCFTSLKTLHLWGIDLADSMLGKLTSGCPCLEDLKLSDCNENSDLNICAANSHLKSLVIEEYYGEDTTIKICAPSLQMIEFIDCMWRKNYNCIKTLQSLVYANFNCFEMNIDVYKGNCNAWAELLGDLHVKHLELCDWFTRALSFNEVRDFTGPSITAAHLELTTGFGKWELPGLAYLLRNSQHLETLTLNVQWCKEERIKLDENFLNEYDFDERNYWKEKSISLQHLKTIKVNNFMGGIIYSTSLSIEEILDGIDKEVQFLAFLLKSSIVLERVIIKITGKCKLVESVGEGVLLFKVAKILLTLPRASPNAKVLIS